MTIGESCFVVRSAVPCVRPPWRQPLTRRHGGTPFSPEWAVAPRCRAVAFPAKDDTRRLSVTRYVTVAGERLVGEPNLGAILPIDPYEDVAEHDDEHDEE
jgi:hypothetical protein